MEPSDAIHVIEGDLRRLVRLVMSNQFGTSWLDEAFSAETLGKLAERWGDESRRRAPALVDDDLLAYSHLYEIRGVIEKRWELFKAALGAKKEFDVFLDRVEDFRNAPSHSRELLPHERTLLEGLAGEIRNKVTVYRSSLAPDAQYYPVIEAIVDSFGNGFTEWMTGTGISEYRPTNVRLQVGQTVTFRCRGWDPQGRDLRWRLSCRAVKTDEQVGTDVTLTWNVGQEIVGELAVADITLASDGTYHRFLDDAGVNFTYAVDPPQALHSK